VSRGHGVTVATKNVQSMFSHECNIIPIVVFTASCLAGCVSNGKLANQEIQTILREYQASPEQGPNPTGDLAGTSTTPPEVEVPNTGVDVKLVQYAQPATPQHGADSDSEPFTVVEANADNWQAPQRKNMTLDEVVQIALANSTVLRGFGGRVVESPALAKTIYGPTVRATNPDRGVEAALSAFDAQFSSDFLFEDNHELLNNRILGLGVNDFRQTLYRSETSLSKRTATGTEFTLRNNITGDRNSSTSNLTRGRGWNWELESEIRQPLLLGRGLEFNQIAGPRSTVGSYRGVMIARLNSDVSVTELQMGLRDYLSNVQNAYWDLYFAYENLRVKTKARDRCLDTLKNLEQLQKSSVVGAEKDKVAQAKEQYFRFEEEVQNALAGRLLVGTQIFNGSGGGTFQGVGGIYACERRLRMIIGTEINDGRLIYTTSEPSTAPINYDWNEVVSNALMRRTELRAQQLRVEKRRLELVASRAFTKPRLDAIGAYRYRGLGDRIYGTRVVSADTGDVFYTPTHEWWAGLSLAYPVGQRLANSAVRNAQLELSREQALLDEVERRVMFGISNAKGECARAQEILGLATLRSEAAEDQYETLTDPEYREKSKFDYNILLDSERRRAEADDNYLRAKIQHALAIKNLNFEMGTLLEALNIHLAAGDWPRHSVKVSGRKMAKLKRWIKSVPGDLHSRMHGFSSLKHSRTAKSASKTEPDIVLEPEPVIANPEASEMLHEQTEQLPDPIPGLNGPSVPIGEKPGLIGSSSLESPGVEVVSPQP